MLYLFNYVMFIYLNVIFILYNISVYTEFTWYENLIFFFLLVVQFFEIEENGLSKKQKKILIMTMKYCKVFFFFK